MNPVTPLSHLLFYFARSRFILSITTSSSYLPGTAHVRTSFSDALLTYSDMCGTKTNTIETIVTVKAGAALLCSKRAASLFNRCLLQSRHR